MTQKDESPNASEGPYWSEELLAVLVVGLETRPRHGRHWKELSSRPYRAGRCKASQKRPWRHTSPNSKPQSSTRRGDSGRGLPSADSANYRLDLL